MTVPDVSPKSSARRRLLGGTFAVPAVMALRSGSVMAATTVSSCVANQVATSTTQGVVTTNDGAWLRVQLRALVNSGGNVFQGRYWISGGDLSAYVVNGQMPFLSSTQFQQFDIGTNQLVVGSLVNSQPAQGGYSFLAVSQFVALRVTSSGAIVSAGATTVTTASSAVSGTCWNSFAAAM